ncbi:MAG: UDP-N-acetylmuramoyl-tripeptide--D-alanyl-D-alanine ligase [Oscillospiraceae bacterium]|nr:UDP-N-acetylmuramoyl-tripeptide--D-alanyl-D-alanine ligase [Oscillospiraceae bacterium]
MAPYLQILFGALTLVSFYTVFKSMVFNFHMFQLNGYRASTHFSWMKKNARHYYMEGIVFALSFSGILKKEPLMAFFASALLVAVCGLAFSNREKSAKKPLVYTPRVKRMIVTSLVIFCALYGAAIFCLTTNGKNLSFLVLGLINALAPVVILISNLINKPMEKGINARYTLQAKRMLNACPDLQTIGITGSYGKTGVKFYLYTILRAWIDTLVTPESYNTPMGIVKTVRGSLKSIHKIFLCEMGAKWVGDIKELCDIVRPKHGIITALGDQHLESFGSVQNIIKTKYELADALPENGRLYVNWDNERIRQNPPKRKFIKYGTLEDCDYRAFDIKAGASGTSFKVSSPDGSVTQFETKLLGIHNVVNITGAVAAANGFGMPLDEMRLYVRRIEAVPHRMQLIDKGQYTIIDDAFNSNPAGCEAALNTLKSMDGMRILVTPGMVELGEKEYELNKTFGKQAAGACDKIVLIGAKQTEAIRDGVLEAGFNKNDLWTEEDFSAAMQKIYAYPSEKKKVILLENDLPDNY